MQYETLFLKEFLPCGFIGNKPGSYNNLVIPKNSKTAAI